jgi:putative oxidoreductase
MTTSPRSPTRLDVSLLLLRTAAAAPLLFHGAQKLFGGGSLVEFAAYLEGLGVPTPLLAALLAALAEVGGALVLLAGWPARAGFLLLPALATMVVAAITSARNGFDVARGGAEYPLVLGLVLGTLVLLGPGAFAVTHARSMRGAR